MKNSSSYWNPRNALRMQTREKILIPVWERLSHSPSHIRPTNGAEILSVFTRLLCRLHFTTSAKSIATERVSQVTCTQCPHAHDSVIIPKCPAFGTRHEASKTTTPVWEEKKPASSPKHEDHQARSEEDGLIEKFIRPIRVSVRLWNSP